MDQFDNYDKDEAHAPMDTFNYFSPAAEDDMGGDDKRTGLKFEALDQINSLAFGSQPDEFLRESQQYTPENETSPFTLSDMPDIRKGSEPSAIGARVDSYEDELDTFGFAPSKSLNPVPMDEETSGSFHDYSSPSSAVNISREQSQSYTPNLGPQYLSPRLGPVGATGRARQSSISNTGKSYTAMGNSLNNIVSPLSTYDFDNSPYGSLGSFNDNYLNSPIASPSLRAIGSPASYGSHMNPKTQLTKDSKINRRRELHNAVERRRRDLIKERIKELGALVPQSLLRDKLRDSKEPKDPREIKANKGLILVKTVEYITQLQRIMSLQDSRLELLQSRIAELEVSPKYESPSYQSPPHLEFAEDAKIKVENDAFDFLTQDFLKSDDPPEALDEDAGFWNCNHEI